MILSSLKKMLPKKLSNQWCHVVGASSSQIQRIFILTIQPIKFGKWSYRLLASMSWEAL